MSETTASLRRKIDSAGNLQSVVRTMKALAASSIGQYENSVRALADYSRTVELGLSVCLRKNVPAASMAERTGQPDRRTTGVIVFGSDQGLVGQFNEVVADMRSRPSRTYRANTGSGRLASASMRAWRTPLCR